MQWSQQILFLLATANRHPSGIAEPLQRDRAQMHRRLGLGADQVRRQVLQTLHVYQPEWWQRPITVLSASTITASCCKYTSWDWHSQHPLGSLTD
jgi:hypothetical protein